MSDTDLVTCARCHGQGDLPSGDRCPRCEGSGEIVLCWATRLGQSEEHDLRVCSHYIPGGTQ